MVTKKFARLDFWDVWQIQKCTKNGQQKVSLRKFEKENRDEHTFVKCKCG